MRRPVKGKYRSQHPAQASYATWMEKSTLELGAFYTWLLICWAFSVHYWFLPCLLFELISGSLVQNLEFESEDSEIAKSWFRPSGLILTWKKVVFESWTTPREKTCRPFCGTMHESHEGRRANCQSRHITFRERLLTCTPRSIDALVLGVGKNYLKRALVRQLAAPAYTPVV